MNDWHSISTALKAIQKELSLIGERLESIQKILTKSSSTEHEEEKCNQEQNTARKIRIDDPIRAEIRPDEATKKEAETENNRQHRTQWSIRNATWWAVIAAAIYAGVSTLQVCELRRQTAQLMESADVARNQYIADQRPWIALNTGEEGENAISFYAPLVIGTRRWLVNPSGAIYRQNTPVPISNEPALGEDTPFAVFDLDYRIKNFGRSPAKVDIQATIENDKIGFLHGRRLAQAVDRMCSPGARRERESPKFPWPSTLPPGSMHFDADAFWMRATRVRKLTPTIVGCIWYQYTTGEDTHTVHVTPFSAHISSTGEGGRESLNKRPLDILVPGTPLRFLPDAVRVVDILTQGNPD